MPKIHWVDDQDDEEKRKKIEEEIRAKLEQEGALQKVPQEPSTAPEDTKGETAVEAPTSQQNQNVITYERYCFSCGSGIKKAAEVCPKCGVNQNNRNAAETIEIYCTSCGKIIKKEALICPFCGVRQAGYPTGYKPKNWSTTLLLCIFLGLFGGHRFYTDKTGTGILMIIVTVFTFGIGGIIWYIIDLSAIRKNNFKDKQGYPLMKNDPRKK